MKVSRVCSEFSYGDWTINLFGYGEGGKFVHSKKTMRDWFYFRDSEIHNLARFNKVTVSNEGVRKTLYGDDVRKVEYTAIKQKKAIDETFPDDIFEADIQPEFRYIVNNNIEWAPASIRHILFFDIEVSDLETFVIPMENHNAQTR